MVEKLQTDVGELIPTVSDEKDGLISKSINPNMLKAGNTKTVFLHKTLNKYWSGFSFLLSIFTPLQGINIIHVFGGIGGDSNTVNCRYNILSKDNVSFLSFSKLKYRIVEQSIEIYLVANSLFGNRTLFQINMGDSPMSTMKILNEEPADLIDFIDYDNKPT